MSEVEEGKKPSVNWGELGKNILAGAAIVAGALIVFPSLIPALGAGLASMGGAFAGSGGALATILKVGAGIGLAIAGAAHFMKDKGEDAETAMDRKGAEYDQRSFAAEQDIRKKQALMVARMQMQGYEPAMAMTNNQMGR